MTTGSKKGNEVCIKIGETLRATSCTLHLKQCSAFCCVYHGY